jgi:hypothetical protein
MKYIITEEQNQMLKDIIWKYLDGNFTPYGGWDLPRTYKKAVESDDEVFFHLVESEGYGDDIHMWYSVCNNHNLSEPIPKGMCPVVTLPSEKAEAIDDVFGSLWKPVFLEWFNYYTKLPIKHVETQDW